MRSPPPSPISSSRRSRYARRIRSPSAGPGRPARAAARRGTASTSPGSRTTAVKNAACPVSRLSSPRKRRGAVHGDHALAADVVALDDRDLALEDDEEVVALVALAEQDLARAASRRRSPSRASAAICSSSSRGNAPSGPASRPVCRRRAPSWPELRRARGGPAPAQEQVETEDEPDNADHHQDDPDGVDVDALDVRRHGELEDRAHGDQEQGGADGHATVDRPHAARGNQVGGAAGGATPTGGR